MHAQMQWIVLSGAGVVVLALCALLYVAARSWRKIATGRWITGLLLLIPHFLLLVCIPFALQARNAPQGSPRFNQAFAADVYIMFLLPVPALLSSMAALLVFLLSRPVNRPDAQATPSEHPPFDPDPLVRLRSGRREEPSREPKREAVRFDRLIQIPFLSSSLVIPTPQSFHAAASPGIDLHKPGCPRACPEPSRRVSPLRPGMKDRITPAE
jgi:hypothetical protein